MKRGRRTRPSRRAKPARMSEGCIHNKGQDRSVPSLGLSMKIHEQLARNGELVELSPRAVLIEEGQQANELFLVESGVLMLSKALFDNRRQVVGFRFPGDLITLRGENQVWCVAVQATALSRVRRIPWEHLHRLLESEPHVGRWLLDRAGDEIAATQRQLLTVGRRNKEERLAAFILEIWHRTKGRPSQPPELLLAMHPPEIAVYLGLTTETVSRVLSQFTRDRLIALPHPSRIKLLNPAMLEDLASGHRPRTQSPARAAVSTS